MNVDLLTVELSVPRAGFRIAKSAETGSGNAAFVEQEGGEKSGVRVYSPDPALFLVFAGLDPNDTNAILGFVNEYGLLGGPYHPNSIHEKREGIPSWREVIVDMKHVVRVDALLRAGDRAELQKLVSWAAPIGSPAGLRQECWRIRRGAGSSREWDQSREPHGDVASADPRVLVEAWLAWEVSHQFDMADMQLEFHSKSGKSDFGLKLFDLHTVLWMQFAQSVAEGKIFRYCKECGTPFELVPGDKGRKVFHSVACKTRDYRNRQARAVELRAAGKTPKQIAEALETDLATIKKWIAKPGGK